MRNLLAAALLVSASPLAAQQVPAPILTTPEALDVWTHAEPQAARVTHVALDLEVDFETRSLSGTAAIDVLAAKGTEEIVLDADGLEISSVTDAEGRPLEWLLGARDPELGSPLTVRLGGAERILFSYRSAQDAGALQWLPPEMTAGKDRPYVFSQGQAINNRSWIPTQDSPGIRQTWEARLTVPGDLVAVVERDIGHRHPAHQHRRKPPDRGQLTCAPDLDVDGF